MRENKDTYEAEPRITKLGRHTARVFRPILTDEERARRMEYFKKCAVDLVLKGKIKNEDSQDVKEGTLVG